MPIVTSNILRVICGMTFNNGDLQNVYHMRVTVSSDPGDATVVDEIADFMDAAYAYPFAWMVNTILFDKIAVWNVSTDTFLGDTPWPTLVAGGVTNSNTMPIQVSPLVLFNTNVNRSQGRKFLPSASHVNTDADGSPTSAILGYMGQYAAALLAGLTGTGWSGALGNWSPTLSRFTPWVYAVARDLYATQRRRYIGRGS